jgi:hypothetical protein
LIGNANKYGATQSQKLVDQAAGFVSNAMACAWKKPYRRIEWFILYPQKLHPLENGLT